MAFLPPAESLPTHATLHRWWDFESIIAGGLYKRLAPSLIRLVRTVVLAVTPACHVDTDPVITGELLYGAADQLENGCVEGVE